MMDLPQLLTYLSVLIVLCVSIGFIAGFVSYILISWFEGHSFKLFMDCISKGTIVTVLFVFIVHIFDMFGDFIWSL